MRAKVGNKEPSIPIQAHWMKTLQVFVMPGSTMETRLVKTVTSFRYRTMEKFAVVFVQQITDGSRRVCLADYRLFQLCTSREEKEQTSHAEIRNQRDQSIEHSRHDGRRVAENG